MPFTSPKLGLQYPRPDEPPDGAGSLANLVAGLEGIFHQDGLSVWADLASNAAFDTNAGLNSVTVIGPIRIVHFAIYRGSGFQTGEYLVNMKSNMQGRPTSKVYSGCSVYDGGPVYPGSCFIDGTGSICVDSISADAGNDGRFTGARGTLVYYGI